MNNVPWRSERPPYPLPTAPAHPAHPVQPTGVRLPHETKKLNPYGLTALVMMLLMICIEVVNFLYFDWELIKILPTGFIWLGAMGLGIGSLFLKNREKVTAIIALVLGVLTVVSVFLFYILVVIFMVWVGGGFA